MADRNRALASQDYLELEMLPAYRQFVKRWQERRAEMIRLLAYTDSMDPLKRAEWMGKLKEVDEVLSWLDEQLGRTKQTREGN